ncbi:MAG: hypothetical protein AB1Z98_12370 [Nannocystaceae bacterium]
MKGQGGRGWSSIESSTWALSALVWLATACGGEAPTVAATAVEPPAPATEARSEVADGDELLRRAREGIRDGALPPEVEAAVLASSEDAHARARRVLLAMNEPPPPASPPASEGDEASIPAPLVPPAADAIPAPVERGSSSASGSKPTAPRSGSGSGSGSSRVGKLALRSSAKGATLTIAGSSKLVVGVANQPSSGLVRVIVERAEAAASVLSARPKIDGVRVTAVRQGTDTLQVTLRLDPGWTLGSVTSFSGGARVNVVAPR